MVVVIEDITEQACEAQQASSSGEQPVKQEEVAPSDSQELGAQQAAEGVQAACPSSSDQEQLVRAEALKQEGNVLYAAGNWQEALDKYADALAAAPEGAAQQRAVYWANAAACRLKLHQFAEAAQDCSAALELVPDYSKVLLRRSSAYEALDDLERALADAQRAAELEPDNKLAVKTVQRLEPVVMERREKLKDEMIGKLKELGNTVLGKFGLSLDNFKAEKDPQTGSYSIKFSQ